MKSIQPRIIAGTYKGQRLKVPSSARPMTDRIKQSVFDSLQGLFEDAQVLDLFAGSGNIGLEALSRGAKSCDFVEQDAQAAELIRQNIAHLGAPDAQVFETTTYKFLRSTANKYDLIFADPPFPTVAKFQIKLVKDCLKPTGVLILRIPSEFRPKVHSAFEVIHTETYGESRVLYLKLL